MVQISSQLIWPLTPCLATRPLLELASARSHHTLELPRLSLDETTSCLKGSIGVPDSSSPRSSPSATKSESFDETDAGPR